MTIYQEFRQKITSELKAYKNVPLLLSGGVDSTTILFALLSMGIKPVCYTFHLENYISDDLKVASSICEMFHVKHKIITVPRDIKTVIEDIKHVMSVIKTTKKVHIQCAIPFMYLCKQIKQDGYSLVLMGMDADDLLGTSRHPLEEYYYKGEEAFYNYRKKTFDNTEDSALSCNLIANSQGVKLIDIYRTKSVSDFLLSLTFNQMHKPIQKYITVNAFSEYWNKGAWFRLTQSLQVNSGIRELHDTLLKEPTLNPKQKRKAIVGIYNDIQKGLVDV